MKFLRGKGGNRLRVILLVLALGGFVVSQTSAIKRQWETSSHNNQTTSLVNATVEVRQASAAHCARCHSDQGFRTWLPQLLKGDPGNIKGPDGKDADVAYLTSLGLTKDKALPVTCSTCHDENEDLRVMNDTPLLPSGFAVSAVGEGALCMTCHNTRNGRVNWSAEDPGRYTGPHASSQGDVIVGKNVFFLNDTEDRISPHAAFTGGACATCHMSLTQESHTFKPPKEVCTNCHGPNMNKEFVEQPTKYLLGQVKAAVQSKVLAAAEKVAVVRAYDAATSKYTDNFALDGRTIQSLVDIGTTGGQIALKVKLTDGREVTSPLAEFREAPGGKQVYATANPIVRASWNYLMIKSDGSYGAHNPRFSRDVLLTTISALR